MELLPIVTQEPLSAGAVQHFTSVIISFLPQCMILHLDSLTPRSE